MVHTEDTFSVYMLTNKVTGKKYIGATRIPLKARWASGKGYRRNKELNADIEKYGWHDGFTHEVIATNLNHEDASELEYNLMNSFDVNMLYNKQIVKGKGLYGYVSKPHNGRMNGKHHSEKTKMLMSEAHKGMKQSDEWVEKRISKIRGKKLEGERRETVVAMCKVNSEKRKRPIIATNITTGEQKYYKCIKDARIELNITTISNLIKLDKSLKGYKFAYA